MNNVYYYELQDQIKFNTTEPIKVKDIVRSLEALEKIVKQSTKTFSKLTNSEVISAELYIQGIEEGSILEKIAIKLGFKTEENFDKFLENAHDWIVDKAKEHPVKTGLAGLVIGGMLAYGFYSLGNSADAVVVSGNYNTVIVNGAGQLGITEAAFREAIEENKNQRRTLAKNAVEFAQTAKTEKGDVSIELGETSNVVIPADVIKAIPETAKAEPIEKTAQMDNVLLNIRSMDRDKYESGWTAIIDGVSEKRLPLDIPLTADLNVLFKQDSIRADITLYSVQRGDKLEHKRIEIRAIHTK